MQVLLLIWELLINLIEPIITLFVAIIISLISVDVLKYLFIRPKINIQIYDFKNGNKAKIEEKCSFKRQKWFIHHEIKYYLTLTGEEFVILMDNQGKSTAKSISLFGWIPSDWEFELGDEEDFGDLTMKRDSTTKDWVKVMDSYFYEEEGGKPFRISGKILPKHIEYIKFKFKCKPDDVFKVTLAGDNIIHREFKIKL